ncbi:class I SAM-dependent methyltransferase [Janibacter sp. CX7]|uniref:class I SAM-dependent methyltransferase n=1 Tax=unclassified Janibacter TaxID=2649294 RepID=UPI0020CE6155|nr:class I SAM-dependent methyltransferase [Janibacter sp. CX7]UTT64917.1 class I SAM-dependent methyltransferase [Janibacter sp. CX7]
MAPDDLPEIRTRWSEVSGGIDAAHAYQRRFDELASGGADLDGEARFVHALHEPPARILDAGCGTGRVATELTRLGHDVVGVDADAAMVEVARERDVVTRFVHADLATLSLSTQTFDVVLLAGNVVPFLADGTLVDVLRRMRAHLATDGRLVAGWSLPGHQPQGAAAVSAEDYEQAAFAADLSLVQRYATWDAQRWPGDGSYALTVHRPR